MPALAGRFRVIAVDLPGQGHSERPQGRDDTRTVATHVRAAVRTPGVSACWLAAHDIGARVAFSLAPHHDDHDHERRLRGVALLDAGIPGTTLPETIPTDPSRAWKTRHFAFHLVPDLPESLLTGREREYVAWFLKAKALDPGAVDDADLDHYAAALAADGGCARGSASAPVWSAARGAGRVLQRAGGARALAARAGAPAPWCGGGDQRGVGGG
ncbi:alpha/beta fold hydrolase [Kineococcus sp. T90]|nr:alpha/beta fold hydrolase [Kineococcus indalonis]NAZ84751.1 alpha/beta fold hydrolase [Kineococcus indalonis]